MENVTITLFIKPDGLLKFLEVLKVLDNLPLENTYAFNPVDIEYLEIPVPSFNQVNVPVELYLKFRYSYNKLKNLSKN
ncbi:MAG: hypothetical protein IPJ01_10075 [Micavibrio sp.]|nr:hypothetical protein [Micavibrio sp.]